MNALAALGLGLTQGWILGAAQAATGSLANAVWQGMLLAAAVGLGLRLLPKTPAAIRFAIWFTVFAVVTALPLISIWPDSAIATRSAGQGPWFTLDARWSLGVAALWIAVSLVRAATLLAAAHRVRTLWKRATPVEVPLAAGLNGSCRRAQLCVSDEVDRPTVIGFFAPKILIPSWLLKKLTAAELEQILLHEAGHLGRADDWMNLFQKIALVLFPINPALAWVERRLCFERELAVDERVLAALAGKAGAAKSYAACLATLAEYRLGRRSLTLALGALGRESELGRRVGRILRRREPMKPLQARLVLGGAMLGLLGAAAGLKQCPQIIGFATATSSREAASGPQPFASNHIYSNILESEANVPHEVQLVASTASRVSGDPRQPHKTQGQFAGYPHTESASRRNVDRATGPDSALEVRSSNQGQKTLPPQQQRAGRVEWVMVTSWQAEDGSRMVLTTATSSNQALRPASDANAIEPQRRLDHVASRPFYAAVPVQGGWLVFQL
jgi:Zn-dependent protease with chaperone function